jgi:poly-beta-1,6-N-acetyl-D-glucosamine synthase
VSQWAYEQDITDTVVFQAITDDMVRTEAMPVIRLEKHQRRVLALIPAHNEGSTIAATINALRSQSRPPDMIYVFTDNCDDEGATAQVAFDLGVPVVSTVANQNKKAGALNRALWLLMPELADTDVVMNFDADSLPGKHFIRNALRWLDRGYGAVGATFHGRRGGGFLGVLQQSEFARFARHQHRKAVCDVLSGTGAAFPVAVLRAVSELRPYEVVGDSKVRGVYARHITEDFELTLAIKTLGHKTVAPSDCLVTTDVMTNWPDWLSQRKRWQLGTLLALKEYGWSKHTREMIVRQYLIYLVMIATPLTAAYLIWSFMLFGIQGINPIHAPLYLAGISIVILEQAWQARKAGHKSILATLSIGPDLLYSVVRQVVYIKAAWLFLRNKATNWGAGTSQ